MNKAQAYRAATQRAREEREHFLQSLDLAKARIAPGRLKQDAKDAIGAKVGSATQAVKDRRWAVGAAGAAFVVYLARRPIGSLLRRLYVRARTGQWETDDG